MPLTEADILARLEAIGKQQADLLEIGEAALLLANLDLPKNSLATYRDELDLFASDLKAATRGAETLAERITALSDTLYTKHQFCGDMQTYDDPQNANLMRVIDRRKGLPVALGILVIHAGRAQGWEITGVNFPGHFLLRLGGSREFTFIDPFDRARPVVRENMEEMLRRLHGPDMTLRSEFVRPVSDRDILLRLQNNLRLRALGENNRKRAMEVLRLIVLIAPNSVEFLAELVQMEADDGSIKSALARLDGFVEQHPDDARLADILSLKEKLSRSLN
jgi:regulator of sirC expression with transglutaminase-like and TPR domain